MGLIDDNQFCLGCPLHRIRASVHRKGLNLGSVSALKPEAVRSLVTMVTTILLANAAVILAFIGGATANLPFERSERRSKVFTILALISLVTLATLVAQNSN
jgi:hypothetical protein